MLKHVGGLFLSLAALVVAVALPTRGADPAPQAEEELFTIAQQTAYQVDPIKIRVIGREDFKVHRLEVVAKVPVSYAKPFQKGDPVPKEAKERRPANGKLTCYGKCVDAAGLSHWGDCARYESSFSIDIWVAPRYECDPSGLDRPGYVIHAVKDSTPSSPDADGKVWFFNGPPRTTKGPHSADCPYRLVINTKDQNEVVQAISMEPIHKAPADGKKEDGDKKVEEKVAPPPKAANREKAKKSTAPELGYVGRADDGTPRTGCFRLDRSKGAAVYVWGVRDETGAMRFLMQQSELEEVGDDDTGLYYWYRVPLAGGLNWFFPKTGDSPSLRQYVYSKVEAPGTPYERYGRATIFPLKVPLKSK